MFFKGLQRHTVGDIVMFRMSVCVVASSICFSFLEIWQLEGSGVLGMGNRVLNVTILLEHPSSMD